MSMKKLPLTTSLLATLLLSVSLAAQADPVVTSREYKVLLGPTLFATQPDTAVNTFLKALKDTLTANGFDKKIKGSFEPDKSRSVNFYDTPGSCSLKQAGYALRERTRLDTGKREIMLKLRATSLDQVAAVNLAGASEDAESKLEADITPGNSVYSYSTKQPIDSALEIDSIANVQALYPVWGNILPGTSTLVPVSNLVIQEKTYDGPTADIGKQIAEFSFTLWYVPGSAAPANAEVSFVVADPEGAFTAPVLTRSEQIMNTLQSMSAWTARDSMTKTAWVYQYQPGFCQ